MTGRRAGRGCRKPAHFGPGRIKSGDPFGEEAGDTEGSFVLSLDTAPTSGQALTADSALLLRYGEETIGTINAEAIGRYYTFGAKRGDIVTIALNRTGGDLDPLVVLLDPRQQPLHEDDDSGPSNNALLESVIIPETGTYYILAPRFDREAGRTTGGSISGWMASAEKRRSWPQGH
jgi:hypothetical protein